jgi:hypothetical protein
MAAISEAMGPEVFFDVLITFSSLSFVANSCGQRREFGIEGGIPQWAPDHLWLTFG